VKNELTNQFGLFFVFDLNGIKVLQPFVEEKMPEGIATLRKERSEVFDVGRRHDESSR
jgi:hypothetical protein